MSPIIHKLYLATLSSIVILVTIYLIYNGSDYYLMPMEERFYHSDHNLLKPNGLYGHGLGIIGTFLILTGVFGYMLRKRLRIFSKLGILKHWLEFHIFLCTLGPIMVLFHTAFKFGGIVSISFWSMVAVVASGVVGRFIYLQIPRTIHGRELNLHEVHDLKSDLGIAIQKNLSAFSLDIGELIKISTSDNKSRTINSYGFLKQFLIEYSQVKKIRERLNSENISKKEVNQIIRLVKDEIALSRKIQRLLMMQRLFRYWHVAHLPFALIMLIIMVIHVAVSVTFGYTWIF
ncbi:MAG: hypothetical protein IPJ13_05915 [Saprospiraceae bacterium]|nr:hypothetical protein [Saprospiraceae bacterium]MBK9567826.1 hypothetical protein [Saprospiraceae bacterium]